MIIPEHLSKFSTSAICGGKGLDSCKMALGVCGVHFDVVFSSSSRVQLWEEGVDDVVVLMFERKRDGERD